jgi:4-aminobutyrate aminotransferase/(S)-3-amino-2-methylpropionate transaminase
VYRAPYPYTYRWEGDDPAGEALDALRRMLITHVAPESVAAIVFEPVQGEGGFVVPPAEWVQGLREIADEHGIVLICDEVQSGYGRTGKMFAVEHFGIEPDLITIAKSMAAGVPISGVFGRAELMDAAPDSSIGGTFVGSPLGCVAGLGVLDEIDSKGLLARGAEIGERIRGRFEEWASRHENIGEVRGLGPMLAVEFVTDRTSRTPAPEIASAVLEHALQAGLILLRAGIHGNCVRVLVSLVATDDEIAEALDIFGAAVEGAVGASSLATTAG